MFISVKRHEREKQELIGASTRLTDAILKNSPEGLFLIDLKDRVQAQVSQALSALFRRQDFANLSFEKLLAPVVSAKTLTVARVYVASLLGSAARPDDNPLESIDVRLPNTDGTFDNAQYSFRFDPIDMPHEARVWMVSVTDVTASVQAARELEELRIQVQLQGEILRGVMQRGGTQFGAFVQRTDASMKSINLVLKKPAREEDAFRHKLEEALHEVDHIRREAAAFRLTELESSARRFEDALHELRSRSALSGSDFLPLAVKLDHLYSQLALIKSVTASAGSMRETDAAATGPRMTESGTQIIEAPKFTTELTGVKSSVGTQRTAAAGSLDSTLLSLTDHVAQEQNKSVILHTAGLQLVPAKYQSIVKNVAIQLIRNAVMHGIEAPAVREAAGKPARGTLRLDLRRMPNQSFELMFEDDGCGLNPDHVRATAIARGVVTGEAAARLRDREAIKLIFKSTYTTLASSPTDTSHGAGMSLVRRYIQEAGGKVALASLLGHETRFKVTLPALVENDAQVA